MGRAEGRIENYLRRRVREEGGQIRKLRWIGRRGAPDNMIWWSGGRLAFVECKAAGEEIDPRSIQGREFRRMEEAGLPVFRARSEADVEMIIDRVKNNACNT